MLPRDRGRRFHRTRTELVLRARQLIVLSKGKPKPMQRIMSNMNEQIYQIHDDADLERLRPYMRYQQGKLEKAIAFLSQHSKGAG